jgi:hypothetical protein
MSNRCTTPDRCLVGWVDDKTGGFEPHGECDGIDAASAFGWGRRKRRGWAKPRLSAGGGGADSGARTQAQLTPADYAGFRQNANEQARQHAVTAALAPFGYPVAVGVIAFGRLMLTARGDNLNETITSDTPALANPSVGSIHVVSPELGVNDSPSWFSPLVGSPPTLPLGAACAQQPAR